MPFDYGEKRPDGQYERYPTDRAEGQFVAPLRHTYIHQTCGTRTKVGSLIAETYAKNPNYYTHTFCVHCKDHYSIEQFNWVEDGVLLGKI